VGLSTARGDAMMPRMLPAATEVEFPSGAWTGFYQQTGRRYSQDMELTFDGGVVRGAGWDNLGEFVIKGSYDLESREVRWTKLYVGKHRVYYRGFREGKGIWGTWRMPGQKRAGFHVWPVHAAAIASGRASARGEKS
jgi:hypothetical protein